ncbi:DUF692 domain-containing protein [Beggiatoa alba]|nr:DUF692 domain-containing protein [Beggiatoa alba]
MVAYSAQSGIKKQGASSTQPAINGIGVGLRSNHFEYIEQNWPATRWFEVLIDNYMMDAGAPLYHLEYVAERYPITFHGVGLSLGKADQLNSGYLSKLKSRIRQFNPVHVSDHLCWATINGYHSHDLLPMPYIDESVKIIVQHIQQVQDFIGQRILIENVSSYLSYKDSAMQEWEFLQIVAEEADCDILLDINNIYVSAVNHKLDAMAYLKHIDSTRVKEMHLAGYSDMGTHLLDTHAETIHKPVWALYKKALERFPAVPTLIEWDNDIPEFPVLEAEAKKAEIIMQQVKYDAA